MNYLEDDIKFFSRLVNGSQSGVIASAEQVKDYNWNQGAGAFQNVINNYLKEQIDLKNETISAEDREVLNYLKLIKNGLVTKDNHDNVSVMFDWYVPLRKFDETTAEEVYGYVTEKGDPSSFIGPALMKAKGRKSLSETNILAQIGAIGNLSISRGGKNAIKQAFARFVRNNGGQGLVTEVNTWVELDGYDANNKPIWKEALPQIPENA